MQAIICGNSEGLVLACDRLLAHDVEGGPGGRLVERRLFPIGSHAAVLSIGGAVGIELSKQLSEWLQARHLEDFDDMLAVSRDLLAQGYARHLHPRHGRPGEPSATQRHLYFVIAGYSSLSAPVPYAAVMLHSEAGGLPFQETRLSRVFTLPRRTALEGKVARQIAEGAGLRTLAGSCRAALTDLAERNPEAVGGPFDVAVIRAAGVEFVEETLAGMKEEEDC